MNSAANLIADLGLRIVERIDLPARPEKCLPIPAPYNQGAIADWVRSVTQKEDALWSHQSLALTKIAAGSNLLVATATASGKSLIFMAPILHELLHGQGTAIVVFPQKALASDQLKRIRAACEAAGIDQNLVGELTGAVDMASRDKSLSECRLIVATPDVIHAWLMARIQSTPAQAFVGALRYVVIDEAHTYENVFGSMSAFLFRRLRTAWVRARKPQSAGLQWIAATATIHNPEDHLADLTGCKFEVVRPDDNGAPNHGVSIFHAESPDRGATGEAAMAALMSQITSQLSSHTMIAFADTRQGVEKMADLVDRPDVFPYRSGYETEDRRHVENGLREKSLSAVISTSALELGVDFPGLTIGATLGVPQTRKSLLQRIGRIGRSQPGAFVLLAPRSEFSQLGGSLGEHLRGEIEPCRLYLKNQYVQFQAARCLLDELGCDESTATLPTDVTWPDGFVTVFEWAKPAASRPRELDQLVMMSSGRPHLDYPLRAIRDVTYALREVSNPTDRVGEIDREKALSEAYPGAIYRHYRKTYRVVRWHSNGYENSIMVQRIKGGGRTQALLCTYVNASIQPQEVIDNRIMQGVRGTFAELELKICDSVEGFRSGGTTSVYRDLKAQNPQMRAQRREFHTRGVLLQIKDDWFSGDSPTGLKTREAIAEALAAVLAREHNLARADLRIAFNKVSIVGPGGPRVANDSIVIFDNVVGGLQLSSPLYLNFDALLDRLERGVVIAGEEAILSQGTLARLRDWHASLSDGHQVDESADEETGGDTLVYAPGSEVSVTARGNSLICTIIEPQLVSIGDTRVLMYRYESVAGSTAWVAHDKVEPVGQHWRRALWNETTNEIRELAA